MTNTVTLGCASGLYQFDPGLDFSSLVTQPPTLGTRAYRDNVIINPTQVPTLFPGETGTRPLASIRPHPDYFLSSGSHYNDTWNGSAIGPQIQAAISSMIANGCVTFGPNKPLLSTWHEAGNLYTSGNDSNGTPYTSYLTASKIRSVHVQMQTLVNTVNTTHVGNEVRYGPITYFSAGGGNSTLSNMESWIPTSSFPMDWYGVDVYDNADQDLSSLTKIQNYLAPYLTFIETLVATPVIHIPECNSRTEANRPAFFQNLANWLSSNGTGQPMMAVFYLAGGASSGPWLPSDTATLAAFSTIQYTYGASAGTNTHGSDSGAIGNSTLTYDTVNEATGDGNGTPGCMAMTSVSSGDMSASSCPDSLALTQGVLISGGSKVVGTAKMKAATTGRTCVMGARFFDASGNYTSPVVFDTSNTVTDNSSGYTSISGTMTAPVNAVAAVGVIKVESAGSGEKHYVDDVTFGPAISMNNPSGDGKSFIGGVDIRGLTDNLNLMMNPPMCVVSSISKTIDIATGTPTLPNGPQLPWDTIHVDTVGGMGAIPGWPNWYVCLVPGFYEIDGCLNWALSSTNGGSLMQAYIIVAMGAAQALASGSGTPTTVGAYACPVGEGTRENAVSMNTANNPTTRVYLGLGDMVALCAEQATPGSIFTATGNGGSHMSLLWTGYAQKNDQFNVNTNINTGGAVGAQIIPVTATKTYSNTKSFSYYGSTAGSNKYHIRYTNRSPMFQGTWDADNGSQYGQSAFPFATMCTDMPLGTAINWATLTFTVTSTYYSSGGKLMLGSCYSTPGENPWHPGGNNKNTNSIQQLAVPGPGTYTMPITTRFIADFTAANGGGSSMTAFWIGNDSTTNKDYSIGYNGDVGDMTLTVNFTTT